MIPRTAMHPALRWTLRTLTLSITLGVLMFVAWILLGLV